MHENQNQNPEKPSIAETREAIGMTHRNYSDDQIQEIIDIMWEAAEFAYEEFRREEQRPPSDYDEC